MSRVYRELFKMGLALLVMFGMKSMWGKDNMLNLILFYTVLAYLSANDKEQGEDSI